MQAFRYRIVTEWSDEDGVFVARVPVLAGCAAHGDSPEEAAKQAREAALGILESMHAHGETPPPEDASVDYSGQLRLRLPKSLHERISLLATAESLSINSLLVSMISEAIGQRRKASTQSPRARTPTAAATGRPKRKRSSRSSAGNPAR